MSDVVVVIGPGSIGQAIARRVSAGKPSFSLICEKRMRTTQRKCSAMPVSTLAPLR